MGSGTGKAGFVAGVVTAIILGAGMAQAQSLRDAGPPAEFPPASYTGNQYVDSRGCVYVRAGVSGTTSWVPRVSRSREVLCGFQPTLTAEAEPPAAAPAPSPEPARTATATPPARPRAAAPADFTPPQTIITAGPSAAPAPASPVVTRVTGTSTTAAPPLARTSASAAEEPATRRLTRTQFCSGRFGLQPGYVSSRTGETIDCGPRPETPRPVTAAATPQAPVATGAGPRRVTRAQICEEIRQTGRQFLNVATGQPVRCPVDPASVQVAEAPRLGPVPARAAGTCPGLTGDSAQHVLDSPATRCGPQAQDPVFGGAPRGTAARTSTRTSGPFNPPVPDSNPAYVRNPNPAPPDGYERVWGDGRLNPNRGLRTPAQLNAELDARYGTRTSARPARY